VSDSSTSTNSTSPRKNRRKKRRRENKNKSATKPPTVGTKIHAKGQGNASNPWQKVRKPIKLSSIMNEQQSEQTQSSSSFAMFGDLMMDEAELLEQQMILEAIAESKKSQSSSVITPSDPKQTNDSEKEKDPKIPPIEEEKTTSNTSHTTPNTETTSVSTKDTNTETQSEHAIHELVSGDLDELQCLSDEMLAIHLQKEEQRLISRNQKQNAYYDGKHSKVTMASVGPTNLPTNALNFYYDDGAVGHRETEMDELTMDDPLVKGRKHHMRGLPKNASKHNSKIASMEHIRRLNEYETGGNLDFDMNIGNQAYGSFKNKMDQKGMKSLHDRCFVPVEKRR